MILWRSVTFPRISYFLLRIEDFVIGDDPFALVERLARWLGLPPDEPPRADREKAAQLGRLHAKSYVTAQIHF